MREGEREIDRGTIDTEWFHIMKRRLKVLLTSRLRLGRSAVDC